MNVLYLCSDFGIPVYGHKGASIHLRAMARALERAGHRVTVVSPSTERVGNPDFEVAVLPVDPPDGHQRIVRELRKFDRTLGTMPSGHAARVGQEIRCLLYQRTIEAHVKSLAALQPDVVYERYALFGSAGVGLARALGVPHLLEVNAPLVLEQRQARGLHLEDVALEIEARTWRATDALLLVSRELERFARDHGVDSSRIHCMPNGVEAEPFLQPVDTVTVRRRWGLGDGPVVGFVGSLKTWHGTEILLEAFERLTNAYPDARLLIVGDGPMRAELERRATAGPAASRVVFTEAVDHARIPELVAAMDVAVAPYLPSDDFYFSPIKIYEYLAAGRPVIASRIGQITELADAGWLEGVPPGDVEALATALQATLAAPEDQVARAARARDWVLAERTWDANARRVADLARASTARA